MKPLGVILTLLAAFALGYSKRRAKLKREALLGETAAFVYLYRSNIEFGQSSVLSLLESAAANERTASLGFLDEALERIEGGEALPAALRESFLNWGARDIISKAIGGEICAFLSQLATSGREDELRRCDHLTSLLAEELREVRIENNQKRGFY
ncbi:MAG: hypothetical protein Q4B42_08185, partial [Oscillospiraceae bacterium]|nr:hypothetical protein [Oscillospiraceae bacterium]